MLAGLKYWLIRIAILLSILVVSIKVYDHLYGNYFEMPLPLERISLVQLLATPEKFDGHRIQAAGYFVFREEQHALFLSIADFENGLPENSIPVVFDNTRFKPEFLAGFHQKYVSVTGRFDAFSQSEWPVYSAIGKKESHIAAIEEILSPPYQYQ